jgi:broad specificity phosphatase PhoE
MPSSTGQATSSLDRGSPHLVRVVLMRHGQTAWNVVGRRQGQLDSPLTQAGVENAKRLAAAIEGSGIDRIFSSPLGRARHTAEIVAERLNLAVQLLPGLAEVHHGAMAGLTDQQISADFPDEWHSRDLDKYRWRFPGGESYAEAEQRALAALQTISATGAALPLVVTHEMLGRMLRKQLLKLSVEEALALKHPQDVAYRIEDAKSNPLPAG